MISEVLHDGRHADTPAFIDLRIAEHANVGAYSFDRPAASLRHESQLGASQWNVLRSLQMLFENLLRRKRLATEGTRPMSSMNLHFVIAPSLPFDEGGRFAALECTYVGGLTTGRVAPGVVSEAQLIIQICALILRSLRPSQRGAQNQTPQ